MRNPKGLLLAVLALVGCSAPALRHADRSVTTEMVQERVQENHARLRALLANGTISVETPDMAQSGAFELMLQKPDSILVRLEGPFGIDVGSALLTREKFSFYNSFNNRLVTGPTNPENLGKILRVDLEFDDVVNLFSGGVFFPADRSTPSSFSIENEEFVLTYHHDRGTRRYFVDPQTLQITTIHHLDGSGRLVLEQIFTKFRSVDGITLPQYVRVTMHRERRRVSIAYADMSVNPEKMLFRFDVPANASRARIQE